MKDYKRFGNLTVCSTCSLMLQLEAFSFFALSIALNVNSYPHAYGDGEGVVCRKSFQNCIHYIKFYYGFKQCSDYVNLR